MTEKRVTSDVKMERLLNLVLALLGSERFVTKSQLIQAIPGYEGSAEAQDRMFERDKDDLRRLGIEIEVKQVDPLFEDEIGYRIRKSSYNSRIPDLTVEEGLVASLALSVVKGIIDRDTSSQTWLRMSALFDEEPTPLTRLLSVDQADQFLVSSILPDLIGAVHNRNVIEFNYVRDSDGASERRTVEPISLRHIKDNWVLNAWDRNRFDFRTFIIENIDQIRVLDEVFDEHGIPEVALDRHKIEQNIVVQAPESLSRRFAIEGGFVTGMGKTTILATFSTFNPEELIRNLIPLHPEVEILEPIEVADLARNLRQRMIDALR